MLAGHSFRPFCAGSPSPPAGPVSGRLTPIVMSASAAPEAAHSAAAATRVLSSFGEVRGVVMGVSSGFRGWVALCR